LVVHGPPRWWIKLADFGLSKRLTDTTAFYTRGGTQSYMAPEILNFITSEITSAIDIWAAGCIIYRLIAGAVPFPPGPALMKYCEDASKFPQNVLFEQEVEDSGSSFIKKLLAAHPQDRLSAAEALRCEWLASGNIPLTV
jgi:serine/threonine protein kinase